MSNSAANRTNFLKALAITLVVGGFANILAIPGLVHWYPTVEKPSYSPPGWLLFPASLIFLDMTGIAAGLIWARSPQGQSERVALNWYWWQLGLSFLWVISFFTWRALDVAYYSVLGVWIALLGCLWTFSKLNGKAAWLLLPYLAWVTYASTVDFNILVQFQRPLVEKMDQDPANDDEPASGLTHKPGEPIPGGHAGRVARLALSQHITATGILLSTDVTDEHT